MADLTIDRKQFLRRLGLGVTAGLTGSTTIAANNDVEEDLRLTEEQLVFLKKYKKWLIEFKTYIRGKKEGDYDTDFHQNIMRLTAEADDWKKELEEHLKDEKVFAYFTDMTHEVKEMIG